ncbi:MAG: hypothetical protein ABI586_06535 [Candidatus Nanopelagicales bacterium]
MIGSLLSSKAAAVALAMTAVTGSAVAATEVLPGTAHRDDIPVVTSDVNDTGDAESAQEKTHEQGESNSEHGQAVSHLATSTNLTGREKGAAISALASGGKSQAGENHGQGSDQSAEHGSPEDPGEQANDRQDGAAEEHDELTDPGSESANPND